MHIVPDSVSTNHPVLFLVSIKKAQPKQSNYLEPFAPIPTLMLALWMVCQHRPKTKDKKALLDNNTGHWRHNLQDIKSSEQIQA